MDDLLEGLQECAGCLYILILWILGTSLIVVLLVTVMTWLFSFITI